MSPAIDAPGAGAQFAEREAWLIRLRWTAIAGVMLVVAGVSLAGMLRQPTPLMVVCATMAAYNLLFRQVCRRAGPSQSGAEAEQRISLQLVCDIGALNLLLHWSGGMENPFAMFFAFHMAIGATLLSRRVAILLGFSALFLFGATVVAEYLGFLPHYSLVLVHSAQEGEWHGFEPWHDGHLVFGYIVAFALMLFGVIYFVRSIEEKRRQAEAVAGERERLALSRERMARVGEISSGVAHTIRNPLHGIMNCVDILKTNADTEASEVLDLVSDGLRRIEMVTRRLLALTRDETLIPIPTDLNDLIRESLAFVGNRRGVGAGVRADLALIPTVSVDPDRLSEALINLLDNAVYACRDGGEVSIHTSTTVEPVENVRIEIRDTGSGIPPEQLDPIFSPFYTTKAIGEGSGLGLPIARKIVEEHGGTIMAESRVGEGSSFVITLPLSSPGPPGPEDVSTEGDMP